MIDSIESKINKMIAAETTEIACAERELTNLKEDIIKGTNEAMSKLDNSIYILPKDLEYKDIENELFNFKKNFDRFMENKTLTSEILHMLVDRIEINAGGTAIVHYRFKEPTAPPA